MKHLAEVTHQSSTPQKKQTHSASSGPLSPIQWSWITADQISPIDVNSYNRCKWHHFLWRHWHIWHKRVTFTHKESETVLRRSSSWSRRLWLPVNVSRIRSSPGVSPADSSLLRLWNWSGSVGHMRLSCHISCCFWVTCVLIKDSLDEVFIISWSSSFIWTSATTPVHHIREEQLLPWGSSEESPSSRSEHCWYLDSFIQHQKQTTAEKLFRATWQFPTLTVEAPQKTRSQGKLKLAGQLKLP